MVSLRLSSSGWPRNLPQGLSPARFRLEQPKVGPLCGRLFSLFTPGLGITRVSANDLLTVAQQAEEGTVHRSPQRASGREGTRDPRIGLTRV